MWGEGKIHVPVSAPLTVIPQASARTLLDWLIPIFEYWFFSLPSPLTVRSSQFSILCPPDTGFLKGKWWSTLLGSTAQKCYPYSHLQWGLQSIDRKHRVRSEVLWSDIALNTLTKCCLFIHPKSHHSFWSAEILVWLLGKLRNDKCLVQFCCIKDPQPAHWSYASFLEPLLSFTFTPHLFLQYHLVSFLIVWSWLLGYAVDN